MDYKSEWSDVSTSWSDTEWTSSSFYQYVIDLFFHDIAKKILVLIISVFEGIEAHKQILMNMSLILVF